MGLGGRSPEVTDLGGRFHHSMSMEPSKRGGQAGSLGPRGCWATRSSRSVLFLFKGTSAPLRTSSISSTSTPFINPSFIINSCGFVIDTNQYTYFQIVSSCSFAFAQDKPRNDRYMLIDAYHPLLCYTSHLFTLSSKLSRLRITLTSSPSTRISAGTSRN